MTIENRSLNEKLMNLEACAEVAPHGTYLLAKATVQTIVNLVGRTLMEIRDLGLHADNSDRLRNLEVAIFDYILKSNPEPGELDAAMGFGAECSKGPEHTAKMVRKAIQDRDSLAQAMAKEQ